MIAPDAHAPFGLARGLASAAPDRAWLQDLAAHLGENSPGAVRTWRHLEQGGLAPLAARALDAAGLETAVAAPLRAALRSALDVHRLRSAWFRRAAVEATRALAAAHIPVLWMKGVWLAHHVFPDPALRPMSDIDLLVPRGRRTEAAAVLATLGYGPSPDPAPDGAAAWTDTLTKRADLPGDARDLAIDLHDVLRLSSGHEWPASRLWDHAVPARSGGVSYVVPSRGAGLLYTAIHLLKHGADLRHAVRAVVDVRLLLQQPASDPDSRWLAQQVEEPYQALAVYLLLSLAQVDRADADALRTAARQRLAADGRARQADRLLEACTRLDFISDTDASFYELGYSRGLGSLAKTLADGVRRWQRRIGGCQPAAAGGPHVLARLTSLNWRYAYTSWLAGRLAGGLRPPHERP